ncbi:toxin glutamine deamidase domain-containing protein [Microbispora catharanthi]
MGAGVSTLLGFGAAAGGTGGPAGAAGDAGAWAGSIRNVNPLGGKNNCVPCALATDSTLGGSPASAINRGPNPAALIEQFYGKSFRPRSIQQIETELGSAGNGSRGIIWGYRGPHRVGHVFNVVNQRGVIRYLDGQSGGAASLDGYRRFYFLRTN